MPHPGYYEAIDEPGEEHWLWYLALGIPLVLFVIQDIVRTAAQRAVHWFRETFALYGPGES